MSIAILFWVYHLNRLPPPSPSQPTTALRVSNNTSASTSYALLAVVSQSRASKFSGSSRLYILITFLEGVAFFVLYFSIIFLLNTSRIILLYPGSLRRELLLTFAIAGFFRKSQLSVFLSI